MTTEQRLAQLEKQVAELKTVVQPERMAVGLAAKIQGALTGVFQESSRTKQNTLMNLAKEAPPPPPRTGKEKLIIL